MGDVGDLVTTEAELREILGSPAPAALAEERDHLVDLDRTWLAASPSCLVATAGADGRCDVSPKGDPPGFVMMLDDTTIAIPERPGNRRVDGFRNVLTNGHVGLISCPGAATRCGSTAGPAWCATRRSSTPWW